MPRPMATGDTEHDARSAASPAPGPADRAKTDAAAAAGFRACARTSLTAETDRRRRRPIRSPRRRATDRLIVEEP